MAENILLRYREIQKEIICIKQQMTDLELSRRVSRDKNESAEYNRLMDRYRELSARLLEEQLEIEHRIESLESMERNLVRYRYFSGLSWEKVFTLLSYSRRQTFRLHAKIIEKLNKM